MIDLGGEDVHDLASQARRFAIELTDTVRAVVGPSCEAFRATAAIVRGRERFTIRQEPETGIQLCVEGRQRLVLRALMHCELDHASRHLTVAQSKFVLHPGSEAGGEPLMRFDYERRPRSRIAAAHVQIHAKHDRLVEVMTDAGDLTRRSRKRASGHRSAALSQLHLPVGGHRFRPCLEDVLDMLLEEFGVDHEEGAVDALAAGRERWRRTQTRAVVRDAPAEAARALAALGYKVSRDDGHAPDNLDRLRAL